MPFLSYENYLKTETSIWTVTFPLIVAHTGHSFCSAAALCFDGNAVDLFIHPVAQQCQDGRGNATIYS
ncbi:MAG: hypothetical protein ACOYJB_04910 [Christensenellaceae bacterium]